MGPTAQARWAQPVNMNHEHEVANRRNVMFIPLSYRIVAASIALAALAGWAGQSSAVETAKAEAEGDRSSISEFSEGIAIVYKKGDKNYQFGFIDKTGKAIVPPQFDEALGFSEGLAAVLVKDKWGFIDPSGKMVIQPQFEHVASFSDGLAPIQAKNKWGYIDKTGKVVIEPRFEDYAVFSDGLAAVPNECKYGYLDKGGKFVAVSPDEAQKLGDEMVVSECRYGYIDKTGQMAIPAQFDQAQGFSDGLAAVQVKEKWGYIDKTGKFVIAPQFDELNQLNEGD